MPHGSMRLDLTQTNLTYTIGQRITIDTRQRRRLTDSTTASSSSSPTPGGGTPNFDVDQRRDARWSYMRVNESVLSTARPDVDGTNAGSTVYLATAPVATTSRSNLLFVRSSVGGSPHRADRHHQLSDLR